MVLSEITGREKAEYFLFFSVLGRLIDEVLEQETRYFIEGRIRYAATKKSQIPFVNQQLIYRSVNITRQGAGCAGFES